MKNLTLSNRLNSKYFYYILCANLFALIWLNTPFAALSINYEYDSQNRLVSVQYENLTKIEYEYDSNGNIKKQIITSSDTDGDGMHDTWETDNFGDLSRDGTADFDNDDLPDLQEYENNTNPKDSDSDDDQMPDGFEVFHNLDPVANDADLDKDNDTYSNYQEFLSRTDPDNNASAPMPPVADAGEDQAPDEKTVVTLDGSGSYDNDDGIDQYAWLQTEGPTLTLSNTDNASLTFTAPEVGRNGAILAFELSVTDNGGLRSTDTVNVNILNVVMHGDVDDNGEINLKDCILVLKILSGMDENEVCQDADINADGTIGVEESTYILHQISNE